jgi:hypothetical protein
MAKIKEGFIAHKTRDGAEILTSFGMTGARADWWTRSPPDTKA